MRNVSEYGGVICTARQMDRLRLEWGAPLLYIILNIVCVLILLRYSALCANTSFQLPSDCIQSGVLRPSTHPQVVRLAGRGWAPAVEWSGRQLEGSVAGERTRDQNKMAQRRSREEAGNALLLLRSVVRSAYLKAVSQRQLSYWARYKNGAFCPMLAMYNEFIPPSFS